MKLEKIVDYGIRIFSGVMLVGMVAVTFLQIVLREIFHYSLNWSDEITQYCMTWLALVGSIWVTKNNRHLNTGFKLYEKLNGRQVRLIDSILALLIAGVAAVVTYQSAMFACSSMNVDSLALPGFKLGYIFIAIPLFMVTVCYYYLKIFIKNVACVFKRA